MTKSQKKEIERIKKYMESQYSNKSYSVENYEKMTIIEEGKKVRISTAYMISQCIFESYLIYIGVRGGLRCWDGKNFVNYVTSITNI